MIIMKKMIDKNVIIIKPNKLHLPLDLIVSRIFEISFNLKLIRIFGTDGFFCIIGAMMQSSKQEGDSKSANPSNCIP
jgi:hypothetical protein